MALVALVTYDNGAVLEALLAEPFYGIAVLARSTREGGPSAPWEALYAVHRGERRELPSCFALSDDARDTLDQALLAHAQLTGEVARDER